MTCDVCVNYHVMITYTFSGKTVLNLRPSNTLSGCVPHVGIISVYILHVIGIYSCVSDVYTFPERVSNARV